MALLRGAARVRLPGQPDGLHAFQGVSLTATRLLQVAAISEIFGVGIFSRIASRQVSVQRTPSKEAQIALQSQRQAIGDTLPAFDLDPDQRFGRA